MKAHLQFLSLAISLAAASSLSAQTPLGSSAPTESPVVGVTAENTGDKSLQVIEQNGQKFVLVSTIKTVQANEEFQHNVNIVQIQKQAALDLRKRIEIALTTPEKEALQKKLEETAKKLDENNTLMTKTYGFSLARNYLMQVVKTRLYLPLTAEEFEKLPETDKNDPEKIIKEERKDKDGNVIEPQHLHLIAIIPTVAENDIFRQNVQLMQAQRNRVVQLMRAMEQVTEPEEKAKLEAELKKSEEVLTNNNAEMIKRYGFSLTRNYNLKVEESRLYMAVTEEELQRTKDANVAGSAAVAPAVR